MENQYIRPTRLRERIKANYIKVVVFVLLSVGLVVSNYFFENHSFGDERFVVQEFSGLKDLSNIVIPQNGFIRFYDKSISNLDNAIGVIGVDSQEQIYLFRLQSGRLWGNFDISNSKLNILMGD